MPTSHVPHTTSTGRGSRPSHSSGSGHSGPGRGGAEHGPGGGFSYSHETNATLTGKAHEFQSQSAARASAMKGHQLPQDAFGVLGSGMVGSQNRTMAQFGEHLTTASGAYGEIGSKLDQHHQTTTGADEHGAGAFRSLHPDAPGQVTHGSGAGGSRGGSGQRGGGQVRGYRGPKGGPSTSASSSGGWTTVGSSGGGKPPRKPTNLPNTHATGTPTRPRPQRPPQPNNTQGLTPGRWGSGHHGSTSQHTNGYVNSGAGPGVTPHANQSTQHGLLLATSQGMAHGMHDIQQGGRPGRLPAMAGAFLAPDGTITGGTSMGGNPNIHPALQNYINTHPSAHGVHHGGCVEVSLLSDHLWGQDPSGSHTDHQWAQQQLHGGTTSAHWGPNDPNSATPHPPVGTYADPCRHCQPLLSGLGVSPVVPVHTQPPGMFANTHPDNRIHFGSINHPNPPPPAPAAPHQGQPGPSHQGPIQFGSLPPNQHPTPSDGVSLPPRPGSQRPPAQQPPDDAAR